ncbi:MAG: 4-hydroxy-tetrahydrodipicolinate reductase [Nitrospinota bacterium]|nr:4-hydroxy-tetrahydrodipicolinate reductase [Nitrospinota bacterium]
MSKRVVVSGAGGRMGQSIVSQVFKDKKLSLSSGLEHPGFSSIGTDIGVFAGVGELGVLFESDPNLMDGDVLISFATPDATLEHSKIASEKGLSLVIGTTGLDGSQQEEINQISKKVPCVFAPNMSVGVNVLFRLIKEAASLLGRNYDIELMEIHHDQKVDSPSGTAVRMGEILCEITGKTYPEDIVFHREGIIGKRVSGSIGIQTLRGGDVPGEHTAFFFGSGERLEITHRAGNRDNFAAGAVRAANWIVDQPPGLYGMNEVLGIDS